MYKGYSIKEKIVLLKLYLYLRAIYLKELYNRKSVSNANVFFNHNINSYLVCFVFRLKFKLTNKHVIYLNFKTENKHPKRPGQRMSLIPVVDRFFR